MAFTALDVKKLREMTNVGMMDCKKALAASDGDMDKAVEWLREKGLAAAAKKSGRIAAEGVVNAVVENGIGAIVEINAETDFASKSDKFMELVNDVTSVIVKDAPADLEALKACKYPCLLYTSSLARRCPSNPLRLGFHSWFQSSATTALRKRGTPL